MVETMVELLVEANVRKDVARYLLEPSNDIIFSEIQQMVDTLKYNMDLDDNIKEVGIKEITDCFDIVIKRLQSEALDIFTTSLDLTK